jgi:hypothetical protein
MTLPTLLATLRNQELAELLGWDVSAWESRA